MKPATRQNTKATTTKDVTKDSPNFPTPMKPATRQNIKQETQDVTYDIPNFPTPMKPSTRQNTKPTTNDSMKPAPRQNITQETQDFTYDSPNVPGFHDTWKQVHTYLLDAHERTKMTVRGYPGNICNIFDSEKACHGIGRCAFWATAPGRLWEGRRGSCNDNRQDFGFPQNRVPKYQDITQLINTQKKDSAYGVFEKYVKFHCNETIRSVYWRLKGVVGCVLRYNHILAAWIQYPTVTETATTDQLFERVAKVKLRIWNLFRSFLNIEIDPWVVRALQSAAEIGEEEPAASQLHVQLHTVIFWARILAVAMVPPNPESQPEEQGGTQHETRSTKFFNSLRYYAPPQLSAAISPDPRDKFSPRVLFALL